MIIVMSDDLTNKTIQKILDEYNKAISSEGSLGKYFIIDISKRHNLFVQARQQYEVDEDDNVTWLDIHELEMTGQEYLTAPELLTKNRIDNMHKFGWSIEFLSGNFSIQVTSDELSNGTVAELIYDSYKIYEIPEKLINKSAKNYIIKGTLMNPF